MGLNGMTSEQFVIEMKAVIKDVIMPLMKEEIRRQIEVEREILFRQFVESRHERTIKHLQVALAAVMEAKEDGKW